MHSIYLYFKGKKVIAIIKQIINNEQEGAGQSTVHRVIKDKTNPQMHSVYLYFKGKKVIVIIKQIINKEQVRCWTKTLLTDSFALFI